MYNYSRRDFFKTAGLGALCAALPGCMDTLKAISDSASTEKPNIILIMADDLGYGDLGCYGNREIETPNIDALADGGMRFTDFHSNGAVCSPTRAALLTGRYQQRCGIEGVITAKSHRHTGMALEETTFAEVLKRAGYSTALFGKWHLGYDIKFNPTKQGFDIFCGYVSGNIDYHSHIDQCGYEDWWQNEKLIAEKGYSTDLITEYGVRFIRRHKDRPFCLYLAHEAPHYPYQGRADKADRSSRGKFPVQGSRKDKRAAYKQMVEAMDEGVGEIVSACRQLGLERRTFIFFCSDNGANKKGSNSPLAGYKGSLWEGGHRVPGIAYWLGKIKAGSVTGETALTMDILATLVSISGATMPCELKLDGVDLLGTFLHGKKLAERTLFWQFKQDKAVRKGPWKLLVEKGKYYLFNLDLDIGEKNNLAALEVSKVNELKEELRVWQEQVCAEVERRAWLRKINICKREMAR